MEISFSFFSTVLCTVSEEIRNESLSDGEVKIIPSTNAENISDIIVGNKPFSFLKQDLNPGLKINFKLPKDIHSVNLLHTVNVLDYDMDVIFDNDNVQEFSVSLIFYVYKTFYYFMIIKFPNNGFPH